MTTPARTTRDRTTADRGRREPAPVSRHPGRLLAALAAVLVVGWATLGPADVVARARWEVMAVVQALAPASLGPVHRAPVEAVANVLLFVPLGLVAALVLRGRSPVLALAVAAAASVLVERAQAWLPGRVPDASDVAANTFGAAVGVTGAAVHLAVVRRRAGRR